MDKYTGFWDVSDSLLRVEEANINDAERDVDAILLGKGFALEEINGILPNVLLETLARHLACMYSARDGGTDADSLLEKRREFYERQAKIQESRIHRQSLGLAVLSGSGGGGIRSIKIGRA